MPGFTLDGGGAHKRPKNTTEKHGGPGIEASFRSTVWRLSWQKAESWTFPTSPVLDKIVRSGLAGSSYRKKKIRAEVRR